MKKILLPTDFSEAAQVAIDYAIALFEKEKCTFFVLNAYQMAPSAPTGKSDAQLMLKKLVSGLTETKKDNHQFEPIMVDNLALEAIAATVADKKVDFVVMGSKGATALAKTFMGSTAVSVVRHVNTCPIITVPEGFGLQMPKKMIFANDLKKPIGTTALKVLKDLIKCHDIALTMVYFDRGNAMNEEQKANRKLYEDNFVGLKYRFEEVPLKTSISSAMKSMLSQRNDVDMVIFKKNRHSFFEKLLREPIIRKVAFSAKIPLLILPDVE
ncbi:universal stress protein [Flagellimonas lutaonensis]|uniref:UspA domain-containing protein n=1 Tax=Flagellimonas lutaonensis TaxID=516051 RepID=A0A0D5YQX0_9FLAO|nr:universal stress protein [Allomuricauda lutaonensis]AKA34241.1 hypothetical protein VC82_568 [Allomuricauda lutaonensis]